jgi:hypothetical protein
MPAPVNSDTDIFPHDMPDSFRGAWLACHKLVSHLPSPQDLEGPQWAEAVVHFGMWASKTILGYAQGALEKVSDRLGERPLALTLLDTARKLFEKLPSRGRGGRVSKVIWDERTFTSKTVLGPIRLPLSQTKHEEAIRARVTLADVRDCLNPLQGLDRNELLARIEDEFRRAYGAESLRRAAAPPAVDAGPAPPVEKNPKQPAATVAGWIKFLGERRYRVAGRPITVSENEDYVLQAFLKAPGNTHSMTTLSKAAGIDQSTCVRVLRKLKGSGSTPPAYDGIFTPFITLPGGKARGGYSVRVRKN